MTNRNSNPNRCKAGRYAAIILCSVLMALLATAAAQAFNSTTSLQNITVSENTGEKPQSKLWTYGGYWWSVLPNSSGTYLYRLDGTAWTSVLQLSTATNTHADAKAAGAVTHVLLYAGQSSQLVSLEYVSASHTYQMWSVRPTAVPITLDAGVETATIDLDSQGRMWLASDANTDMNVRYSDSPYSSWSAPITLATGISTDDIGVVTTLNNGSIGVLWSNQNSQRFGFRTHVDGVSPTTWSADEVPASQSGLSVGAGMADDHMHVAVASNGTLYAAVKTSYDTPGNPKIALLVRRPAGTWDNLYEVDQSGTRAIVVLNEAAGNIAVVYTTGEGSGDIVCKQTSTSSISFGPRTTLLSGSYNESTSTKQNYANGVVIMASSTTGGYASSVLASSGNSLLDSLVALWSMDEGSGTLLVDSSGRGNHGNLRGGATWVTGKKNLALSLSGGTTQYASVPNAPSLNITSSITLAAWIAPSKKATQRVITKAVQSASDGYELSLSSGQQVFVRFNQKTNADTYRLNSTALHPIDGATWMHVAATYDGSRIRMYINGVLTDSGAVQTFSILTNTDSLYIGKQKDNINFYGGKIDDARIYNRALTLSEIQQLAMISPATHTITASAGANGSISPSGAVSVTDGGSQTFTMTPGPGYQVADVLVDGGSVGAVPSYTFNAVTADHSISVSFAAMAVTHTITASAGANGAISPSGAVLVSEGADQLFTITPNSGYGVADVLVDGSSVGAPSSYTFTNVTTDHSISAGFVLLPSLVAHLAMEENGGSVLIDSSTYGNNAAILGGASWVSGVKGLALSLSGSQYATIADNNSLDVTNAVTLAAWIRPNAATTQYVLKKATTTGTNVNGYELSLAAAGSAANQRPFIRFNQATSTDGLRVNAVSQYPVDGNTWMHIAATYDGATIRMYVNGVQENFLAAAFTIGTNALALGVGAQGDGASKFSGSMDEARVYNRALSAAEILALATNTRTITATAGEHGLISPNGAVSVNFGANQTFTITPDPGYHVADVLADGVSVGAVPTYQFTNVTVNHTISAMFAINSYTITASSGANGTVTPDGVTTVNHGGAQTYTITPTTGYHIVDVLVDGVSAGAVLTYPFSNVTANHTISATFAIDTYTITASSSANGTVAPAGITTVNYGGAQTYTITPNPGYHVADVLVDGVSAGAVLTYPFSNVTANHTISATFAIDTYTITASSGASGTVTPDGMTIVNYGGAQTYTITPTTGYHVVDVLVDGVSAGAVLTYPFSNVTANHTISATFAINTYTITASSGANGTVTPDGVTTVNYGGAQTYTITSNPGYNVDNVLVDGASVGAVTTYQFINVVANHTISASFSAGSHTITASAGSNGSISPSGAVSVGDGGSQIFTMTPNLGCHVADVLVDEVSVGAVTSYEFTNVTSAHTIIASFAINTYTISASSGPNGSVTPTGVTTVAYGGGQTYAITPNGGYHVADVLVDGASVGAVESYAFTNVTANRTISAAFALNTHTITASAGVHGSISPSGAVVVGHGTDQLFTITADPGYHVYDVLLDGGSLGAVTSYTITNVTADHTLSASFAVDGPVADLVVHYAMEENVGNQLRDSSTYLNHATLTGGPTLVPGMKGLAMHFDGSTQYGLAADNPSLDITNAITLMAWLKPEKQDTQDLFKKASIDNTDGYELTLATGSSSAGPGRVFVRFNQKTNGNTYRLNSTVQYPYDGATWIHVAATYDGSTIKMYINGQLDATLPAGITIAANALPLSIGAQSDLQRKYQGSMDEIRIYNRALSAAEIAAFAAHNHAPDQPNLIQPANAAADVALPPVLQVGVTDPDIQNMTVTYYGRPVQTAQDFSIVVLPDAQNYTGSLNGGTPAIFTSQMQWILDNRLSRNIVYVGDVGDAVNDAAVTTEWSSVSAAFTMLEGVLPPDGLPFGLSVGNHEQNPKNNPDGNSTLAFNQNFGEARFGGRSYYGGHFATNNDDQFQLFDAGGMSFIVVYLEYDETPDAPVLNWADSLLAHYSGRRAIVVSHYLVGTGNPGAWSTQGSAIYNALKDNPNLFLMVSGHIDGEGYREDVFNGDKTYTLLSDYQGRANGGSGWLRLMEFSPANNEIRVKTYSPWLNQWETDANSQFTMPYNMLSNNYQVIATNSGVPSGTTSTAGWPGLNEATSYEWYVTVSDGESTTTGPVWNFSTGHFARTISATAGSNGAISPVGEVSVPYGASPAFTITPDVGYHVADVQVDGESVGAVLTYSFTNVTANHTINATFSINPYTITASSDANGSVTPAGVTIVNYGGAQAYTITPNTGYHVADVLVDGVSVGAVLTYPFTNVSQNHTISATFAINTYTITASSDPNGTVAPSGVTTVNYGGAQTYTITPTTGYHVADVLVDGISVGAVLTYAFANVTVNHTISATFVLDTFTITASSDPNGAVTPAGVTTVTYGGAQTYAITPNTGYHVADVLVDGVSVGAVLTYPFSNVTANHTISATFAVNEFTITASAGVNGSISPSGAVHVTYGENRTFDVTAEPGYEIDVVTVDNVAVGAVASYTFTAIAADHSIHATFKASQVAPQITSSPVLIGMIGSPYSYTVTASGLPSPTFALTVKPLGMTIDVSSGLIQWLSTSGGDYDVTVTASNTVGTADQSYVLHVECCNGKRGNVELTGFIDLRDLSALVSFLTGGGFVPACMESANVNGQGAVDIGDLSALISFLTGGSFELVDCH